MQGPSRKVLLLTLSLLVLILVASTGTVLVLYAILSIKVSFADDQTAIFEDMRVMAISTSDADEMIGCLEYVTNYYPSGTKQAENSKLDAVVERARRSAVREIIALLRKRTGQDLGDDLVAWIKLRQTRLKDNTSN